MKFFQSILLACLSLCAARGYAQIEIALDFDSPSFMRYEPIMAHVKISNFTGHTIGLFNYRGKSWLSFYVSRPSGEEVDSLGVEYDLHQVQVAGGDTLTINVNLTPGYNIRDPGLYRVMATVYSASYNRQFSSNIRQFDLTTGRKLWEETVAVLSTNAAAAADITSSNLTAATTGSSTNEPLAIPAPEDLRTYALLAKHVQHGERLYARVEDQAKNVVYGMIQLGVLVGFGRPDAMIDRLSHLHVLHQVGSREFAYADIGPDGKVVIRKLYSNLRSKPELRADESGNVFVYGGEQTFPNPAILPLSPFDLTTTDTPFPKETAAQGK